ncbi:MAG: hypothetical protein HY298_05085 [Verrucomicrobia bacterium]|nr:hypothetical protein [Verrucomicrobiota bacterium]
MKLKPCRDLVWMIRTSDSTWNGFRLPEMNYYAHTAADNHPRPSDGRGVGGEDWQPLSVHLCSVADSAKKFAGPLGLAAEAERVGLLHDLSKI